MTTAAQHLPEKVPGLNTLDLTNGDWAALRDAYGACKGGTWRYEAFANGAAPGFKLAAQIDLDRAREDTEHVLDWQRLLGGLAGQTQALAAQATAAAKPAEPVKAPLSLLALAQQIEHGEQPLAAAEPKVKAPRPTFDDHDLAVLRGSLAVAIAETDGSPAEHDLYRRIDAYLTGR